MVEFADPITVMPKVGEAFYRFDEMLCRLEAQTSSLTMHILRM